ncbi:hypothetical protein JQ600_20140 [Bradyrhizobium sp. AUGA SZCCT0176]|uniref:hypothetical protein n=1 Tax=Bradyrhizobium sp. AUGA SZCCT0176 TaxID=2807664 RepID=UPI001BA52250|nr:hypothetical protein [Bradyrhizobium sp. AUGA SZCCT0176]MBR1227242.1 hypothetical protein [Bradyrhizobium sp. AUGA SZCCT0176]
MSVVTRNLIPLKAAIRKLSCGRTKAYELINAGKLIAYTQDGKTMVDADCVDAYQASLPRLIPGARKVGKNKPGNPKAASPAADAEITS